MGRSRAHGWFVEGGLRPAVEAATPSVQALGRGFGGQGVGTGRGNVLAYFLPNNPHYFPDVLFLADSKQQKPDLNAIITCLFEEKIRLKRPRAFSLQFGRQEGSGGQEGREKLLRRRVFELPGPQEAAVPAPRQSLGRGSVLGVNS